MRRKPSNGSYNNQHRRPQRYQQGGGEQRSHQHQQHGRPRRNYGAAREKYLNQARDALAAGDRVAAENWFQHADHCYRMMAEEGQFQPRPQYTQAPQPTPQEGAPATDMGDVEGSGDGFIPSNTNALPAFITANPASPPVDPATIQNWEDRDA